MLENEQSIPEERSLGAPLFLAAHYGAVAFRRPVHVFYTSVKSSLWDILSRFR